jgi:Rho termination factor, N-terminal domain.
MVTQAAESEMDLEQYTVAELKDIAAEEGIDVPSDARKDEIIKAIEQGRQGKDAVVTPLALTGPVIPLPLSGIVADVYGIGRKYNIQLADLQALGAIPQANFLLDNLSPAPLSSMSGPSTVKLWLALVSPRARRRLVTAPTSGEQRWTCSQLRQMQPLIRRNCRPTTLDRSLRSIQSISH